MSLQARMKLPKKRRRVVAVEAPRRIRRTTTQGGHGHAGHGGSIGPNGGGGAAGPGGSGLHRRMNAIKAGHQNHEKPRPPASGFLGPASKLGESQVDVPIELTRNTDRRLLCRRDQRPQLERASVEFAVADSVGGEDARPRRLRRHG
jgi:hypothetical protein